MSDDITKTEALICKVEAKIFGIFDLLGRNINPYIRADLVKDLKKQRQELDRLRNHRALLGRCRNA